jgi:hypothetical protein
MKVKPNPLYYNNKKRDVNQNEGVEVVVVNVDLSPPKATVG